MSSNAYTPTQSPSARQPRIKHVPLSVLGADQVGHAVRTRPNTNTGFSTGTACIAIGWVFAFAAFIVSPETPIPEEIWTPIGLMFCAIALISFGVGCKFRDERNEK